VKLMTVAAARAAMLAGVQPLELANVPLAEALGRVLAGEVRAMRNQPPVAVSSMDGWAVRAEDGGAARRIVGESAAGRPFAGRVGQGEAARIFTGAPVPEGADSVVIQEEARREGDRVTVPEVAVGAFVRRAGLDFAAGDVLLRAGVRLDPWRLALAAAAGRGALAVARAPEVTILSTGDEVVAAGAAPGPAQIFDSASPALTALAVCWGAAARLAHAGDDETTIADLAAGCGGDLLVTLGGASVGDHDLVKPALRRLGLALAVESVAVRPGKPTWFGRLTDGRAVLGLPGNPASALVCAELFLRPLLNALQGADPAPRPIPARLEAPLPANGPREHWMRARLVHAPDGGLLARPLADQDSSLVTVFAEAQALLRRAADAPAAGAGDAVEILLLDRL
jgi:molybdopterin molybdotransferase